MRYVLRALLIAIWLLAIVVAAMDGSGPSARAFFLEGGILLAVLRLGDLVAQLLAEARRHTVALEAQRTHLHQMADVQAAAWARKNAA